MSRKWVYTLCVMILVIVLAGCASRKASAPTRERSNVDTVLPSSTPPPAPTLTPKPTATLEPTRIPDTPTALPATDTPLPPATPTPAVPVIEHLSAGQEITITWIHMLDASNGWGIGGFDRASDHVFATADGGHTWRDVTPPEPAPAEGSLAALGTFADIQAGWVIYRSQDEMANPEQSVVWHTQDGGQTWLSSAPLDIEGLNEFYWPSDLVFADAQHGWLLVHVGAGMSHDYVALYRTTDGAQTWARLLDPYGDSGIQSCQKTGITFTSAQDGWLTGDCGGVMAGAFLFHTTDGGSTWQPVTLPAPQDAPRLLSEADSVCGTLNLTFSSTEVGVLVVRCVDYTQDPVINIYYLYSTRNGGAVWEPVTSPAETLAFVDGKLAFALGRDLFTTADDGQTWTRVKSVNWDGQFSFVSDQLGWAVARAETETEILLALVQTTDGGKNWSEIQPVIAP